MKAEKSHKHFSHNLSPESSQIESATLMLLNFMGADTLVYFRTFSLDLNKPAEFEQKHFAQTAFN